MDNKKNSFDKTAADKKRSDFFNSLNRASNSSTPFNSQMYSLGPLPTRRNDPQASISSNLNFVNSSRSSLGATPKQRTGPQSSLSQTVTPFSSQSQCLEAVSKRDNNLQRPYSYKSTDKTETMSYSSYSTYSTTTTTNGIRTSSYFTNEIRNSSNNFSTKPLDMVNQNRGIQSLQNRPKPISSIPHPVQIESTLNKPVPIKSSTSNRIETEFNKQPIPIYTTHKHRNNGYCIVFNHENFLDVNIKIRDGTKNDVHAIINTFKKFNITPEVQNNLKLNEIRNEINRITKKDFEQYRCLIIFILTHGETNNMLEAYDKNYNLYSEIINPITQNNKSLLVKPKFFFIQACKGGKKIQTDSRLINPPRNMLLCTATYEGFVAYRDTEKGAFFIQALCKQLQETGQYETILEIITKVNNSLSNPDTRYKQVPTSTSTLTDRFCLGRN